MPESAAAAELNAVVKSWLKNLERTKTCASLHEQVVLAYTCCDWLSCAGWHEGGLGARRWFQSMWRLHSQEAV